MVTLVCHHGGRITHSNGSVGYIEGKVTTTQAAKNMLLVELKQIISRACKLSDDLADIDLNLKVLIQKSQECYRLIPINMQVALDVAFEIFQGDPLEMFVTTRGNQAAPKPASARQTGNIRPKSVPFQGSVPFFAQNVGQSSVEVNLKVGLRFESKEELDAELKKWHIKNAYDYYVGYSSLSFVIYKCKSKKCLWSLQGSLVSGEWEISQINVPHTCMHTTVTTEDKQPDIDLMAETIDSTVRADTGVKVSTLQEMLRAKFMQDVSLSRTWRAKQTVIEKMYGTHEDAFQQLPGLMLAIQQSNPETVFEFSWWKKPYSTIKAIFNMVFWAFGASIEGFKYCRPLISIGATALCGKYAGNLLVAVGYDSNNEIYPLCYAIVNSKTTVSWIWFLERVRRHVTGDRTGICILSDCDDEIKLAVEKVFPKPSGYHRFCAHHLAKTFNHKFKDKELKERWYEMASCTFKPKFDAMFEEFKTMEDEKYREWLTQEKKETWALAYDKGYRYGIMATKVEEVFGDFLRGTHVLPVTAVVEATFFRTNDYFNTRRAQIQQSIQKGDIWPCMLSTEIEKCMEKKCDMEAIVFSHGREYQVLTASGVTEAGYDVRGRSYFVNLEDRICDCGEWTLFHRPCAHAMSAIAKANLDYKDYVDPYLGMDSYLGAYTHEFHPIRNENFWPKWTGPVVECDPTMLRKAWETSTQANPPKRIKNHGGWNQPNGHP